MNKSSLKRAEMRMIGAERLKNSLISRVLRMKRKFFARGWDQPAAF